MTPKMNYIEAREARKALQMKIDNAGLELRDGKINEAVYQATMVSLENKLRPIAGLCDTYEASFKKQRDASEVISKAQAVKAGQDWMKEAVLAATNLKPEDSPIVAFRHPGEGADALVEEVRKQGLFAVNVNFAVLVSASRNLDVIEEALSVLDSDSKTLVVGALLGRNKSVKLAKLSKKGAAALEPLGHSIKTADGTLFTAYH